MEQREAYTREEVAQMLGVNPRTVTREIQRGNLKAFNVGRAVRITRRALMEFMGEGGQR